MIKPLHLLALLFFCLVSLSTTKGQIEKYQAAYIYNFTKYLDWPQSNITGNFIIGVYGSEAGITNELRNIAKTKKALNKNIEVKVYASLDNTIDCHILFVPENKNKVLLNSIQNTNSILLITKGNKGIELGYDISFIIEGEKLRFELNTSQIKQKQLKLNPSLEALAHKVY